VAATTDKGKTPRFFDPNPRNKKAVHEQASNVDQPPFQHPRQRHAAAQQTGDLNKPQEGTKKAEAQPTDAESLDPLGGGNKAGALSRRLQEPRFAAEGRTAPDKSGAKREAKQKDAIRRSRPGKSNEEGQVTDALIAREETGGSPGAANLFANRIPTFSYGERSTFLRQWVHARHVNLPPPIREKRTCPAMTQTETRSLSLAANG